VRLGLLLDDNRLKTTFWVRRGATKQNVVVVLVLLLMLLASRKERKKARLATKSTVRQSGVNCAAAAAELLR